MAGNSNLVSDERFRAIFNRFDKDGDGFLTEEELQWAMIKVGYTDADADTIMRKVDLNNDKRISFQEFCDAATYKTNENGQSTADFNILLRLVASVHVAPNNFSMLKFLKNYNWCPPPIFMICVSIVQIAVFCYYNSQSCAGDPAHQGLECPRSFSTPLAFRPQCRQQAYRFFTYIFIHVGVPHLVMNIIVQLLVGLPLEIMHGPFRLGALYCIGGLAGSLGSSVFDPNTNLVGASGAAYAIIGAQVANLVQNWGELSYNWVIAVMLGSMCSMDFAYSCYQRYGLHNDSVSYTAHFCGFLMGCTLGTYVLKNLVPHPHEKIIKYIGVALALGGVTFAIFWNIFYTFPSTANGDC